LTLAILKVVVSWPVHRAASLSPGARIRSGPPFASSVFQLVRNDDLVGGQGGINFRQSKENLIAVGCTAFLSGQALTRLKTGIGAEIETIGLTC
jgi:hypothetical protein